MADFNRCISAMNKAIGRELDAEEVQVVFERIQKAARDLAAGRVESPRRPKQLPRSTQEAFRMAAEMEAEKIIAEAERKARNAVMDVQTIQARQADTKALTGAGLSPVEAVRRLLINTPDGKADNFSLESRVHGVKTLLQRQIQDTWLALDRSFIEYLQGADKVKLLIREIKGENTGDPIAKKGAEAWLKMAEDARTWFNEKGGAIGRLEDWGLPQHHSQELVARAGKSHDPAANRAAWVDFVMPRIDQGRYVDVLGNPMSEAEIRAFLGEAWITIATGGANKIKAGEFTGKGARSNRHAEERQIHFKDADAVMEYWAEFGEKTFPDILMGHVESMAKDIAFLEHFGSNPDATFRLLRDTAQKSASEAAPTDLARVNKDLATLDRLYDYAAGKTKPVANIAMARGFDTVKNLNVAGKLGSAMWASLIGDKVMFEAMGHVNNLPAFQRWRNELRMLNPANAADRVALRQQGLMLDYMTQAMHRFGEELGRSSLSAKLANGVMKVSGMAFVNEMRRGAWALSAMDAIGRVAQSKAWAQIGDQDMRLLKSYGITEGDFRVWKLAKLDDFGHGNDSMLTPDAIGRITDAELRAAGLLPKKGTPAQADAIRRDAQVKLMGALTSESHLAVIEPGWEQRAMMYGGMQRGMLRDELTRSFWQFKAFPITQFERILQVGMSRPTTPGKVGFLTAVPIALTMAGAMMIQVQEMLAGKDPRPMGDWKFWLAAFMKGGSLGIYGDFLFSAGETRVGSGPLEAVAGPTIGAAADMAKFIAKAPSQVKEGKDPLLAAKAVRIAKAFVPGQNLWFTKAATDHMIFQNIQELLNPGYLANMRAKTAREYGNDWWWEPGEAVPDRSPNLGSAIEGN